MKPWARRSLWRRAFCSARCSTADSGGRCVGAFRPIGWGSGFSAACCCAWALALGGFYFVADGHWQRLLLCLLGFVVARIAVTRLTRPPEENPAPQALEGKHAP